MSTDGSDGKWTAESLAALNPRQLASVYDGMLRRYERAVMNGMGRPTTRKESKPEFWNKPLEGSPTSSELGLGSKVLRMPRWLRYGSLAVSAVTTAMFILLPDHLGAALQRELNLGNERFATGG